MSGPLLLLGDRQPGCAGPGTFDLVLYLILTDGRRRGEA